MADFVFENATYARSKTGLNKLISNLQGDISRARKKVKGSEYTRFINTVRKNWSGVDADKFIASFKKDVDSASAAMGKYSKQIETTLRNDHAQFAKMQNRNASSIK